MAKSQEPKKKNEVKIIVNGKEVQPEVTNYVNGKPVVKKPPKKDKRRNGGTPGRKDMWTILDMDSKMPLVENMARSGMTEQDMHAALGVSKDTWYRWKLNKPEFKAALLKSKEVADAIVESALFRRAIGYQVDEVTKEMQPVFDENGEIKRHRSGLPVMAMQPVKIVKKEVAPDTTAAIFWMKNRKPAEWRDKQHVEHSGGMNLNLSYMSDEELAAELARLKGGK